MTDRILLPEQTNAFPTCAHVPINENNRSDANDSVDRLLGFGISCSKE